MRRRVLLALTAQLACSDAATIELIPPEGWRSALVAVDSGSTREVIAHDGPGPLRIERPSGRDVEVVVLFYRVALADLAMAPGSVPFDSSASRPAPPTDLPAVARVFIGGSLRDPEILVAHDLRRDRVRLPVLSDAACALGSRCLELDGEERRCVDDCAVSAGVSVEKPRAPEPLEVVPCAPGWSAESGACVPPLLPQRLSCELGQAQHFDAIFCASVGTPCPADDWPTSTPAGRPLRFVHPGGQPGPGGEVSHTTIAEALRERRAMR